MYTGYVACCPLVSHCEYADGRDGRTPNRYITLSARRGQRNNGIVYVYVEVSEPYKSPVYVKHYVCAYSSC